MNSSDGMTGIEPEKPTVVRIEYEYSDGTVTRATGDDANSINEAIMDAFAMDQIHGGRYSGPYLKPVDRKTSELPTQVVELLEEISRLQAMLRRYIESHCYGWCQCNLCAETRGLVERAIGHHAR